MKLIVGLGNPGIKYKNTRHNIGYLVIEKLAEELGAAFSKKQYNGLIGTARFKLEKIFLLKPLTYMNLSGLSVQALLKKNNISPNDLLVICDDVNLKLGALRLRADGSAGGHNGLKSIIQEIASSGFARLRIGIANDTNNAGLSDFVLQAFSAAEKKAVSAMVDTAVKAILSWLDSGLAVTMNKFNKHFIVK